MKQPQSPTFSGAMLINQEVSLFLFLLLFFKTQINKTALAFSPDTATNPGKFTYSLWAPMLYRGANFSPHSSCFLLCGGNPIPEPGLGSLLSSRSIFPKEKWRHLMGGGVTSSDGENGHP